MVLKETTPLLTYSFKYEDNVFVDGRKDTRARVKDGKRSLGESKEEFRSNITICRACFSKADCRGGEGVAKTDDVRENDLI